ncbi:3',5'-cyclic-nucleotide phosphodiesterase [Basidiobolus ranarum]|uniref:Phosphodiesterase n=1 Tax=Basidiobolus ranarum TaxID=34480 RepID=A0ABR2VZB8_9FUNG
MHYNQAPNRPLAFRSARSTSYDHTALSNDNNELNEQPTAFNSSLSTLTLTSPVGLNETPGDMEPKDSMAFNEQYTPPISPTDPAFHQFFLRKLSFRPSEVKVLIYDEDILHGRLVRQHLRKIGYLVDLVADKNSALAILRRSCSDSSIENQSTSCYQLVIVSITCENSDGFNEGLEVLQLVRSSETLKDLPVIMMADPEQLELACNCLQLGADDYVLKPVRLETVKTVWRSVWRKRKEHKVMLMLEEERNKRRSLQLAVDKLQDQMLQAIETPINLITRTVTDLLQSTGMSDEAKNTLATILSSLKSTNLYRPAFEKLLHNKHLDAETRNWLSTEVIKDALLSTPPDGVLLERSRYSYPSRHRRASSFEGSINSAFSDSIWPSEMWDRNRANEPEDSADYKNMRNGTYYHCLNQRRNSDTQQLTRFANGFRSRRQRIHSIHEQASNEEPFGPEGPSLNCFLELSDIKNEDAVNSDNLSTGFKRDYTYDKPLENIPECCLDGDEDGDSLVADEIVTKQPPVTNDGELASVDQSEPSLDAADSHEYPSSNRNGLQLSTTVDRKNGLEAISTVPPTPTSECSYPEPPPSPMTIVPQPQRAVVLNSWGFDVWSYTEMELLPFLVDMFNELGFIEHYNISLETLTCFFHAVKDGYNTSHNPYHNFRHAFDVTQAGFLFLREACDLDFNGTSQAGETKLSSKMENQEPPKSPPLDATPVVEAAKQSCDSTADNVESSSQECSDPSQKVDDTHCAFTMNEKFAFIIACLCHDLSHDGHTNNFHVATNSELAILYNDCSVLENFHAHQTFVLLRSLPEANIFSNLSASVVAELRSIIIKCILATDMGKHMEVMANFNECVTSGWRWDDRSHRLRLLEMLMKCADISNTARPLHLARVWSDLIQEEMFNQGDQEKDIQLPVSAFGDRDNPQQPRLAITFADFVVTPLFKAISGILPSILVHVRSCSATREYWSVYMNSGRDKSSAST